MRLSITAKLPIVILILSACVKVIATPCVGNTKQKIEAEIGTPISVQQTKAGTLSDYSHWQVEYSFSETATRVTEKSSEDFPRLGESKGDVDKRYGMPCIEISDPKGTRAKYERGEVLYNKNGQVIKVKFESLMEYKFRIIREKELDKKLRLEIACQKQEEESRRKITEAQLSQQSTESDIRASGDNYQSGSTQRQSEGSVYVHGYFRKDGTYVHPYTRSR